MSTKDTVSIKGSILIEGTYRPEGRGGRKEEYAVVVHLDDSALVEEYVRRQLAITLAALGRQGRLPQGSEIKISELENTKRVAASPEAVVRRLAASDPEAAARLLRKVMREYGVKL